MHVLPWPCSRPGRTTCTRCCSNSLTSCNTPAHAGLQRMTANRSCSFYAKRHYARATAVPSNRPRATCTRPSSCCTTAPHLKAAPRMALPLPAWRQSATCNGHARPKPRPASLNAASAHARRWTRRGCAGCRHCCTPCAATIRQPSTAPYPAWTCWVSARCAASTGNRSRPVMPMYRLWSNRKAGIAWSHCRAPIRRK
ncbi:hypothetical protein D3C79_773230 [compost metagenome]